MTLLVTTSASISTFFLVLGYFIDMGYVWGWWIWGALMAAGVFVLFRAGVNRTQYHFDIWAVIIVLANALFAVFAVVLQLWGSVSMELIVYCGLWLVFSLLLAAWILFGKRMLGQPYP
jgi:drug/metabolite transporter (DMT)-like permease